MINLHQHTSLLIYCREPSPRLQYISQFIFAEQLGIESVLTHHKDYFHAYEGARIAYTDEQPGEDIFWIYNHPLLFEEDIRQQEIFVEACQDFPCFFAGEKGDFPFDIFAASFYLLSRYEEYLPHTKDMYGRYDHQNSLAFCKNFLQLPVVNIWINELAKVLQQKFPDLHYLRPGYSFLPTYDIDIAYCYKGKGLLRNIGGFMKSPSAERLAVLAFLKKDPFDCYSWLDALHDQFALKPIYFLPAGRQRNQYDKNLSPYHFFMWRLMKKLGRKYEIGLHPSWASNSSQKRLLQEKKIVETAAGRSVRMSRQHYIYFNLPEGYERLLEADITDDYSMGYGSINGFRASVASSFYWFNLRTNHATLLRLHPFCFMDANSFYEQQQTAEETKAEIAFYGEVCKAVGGQMISIFHNNFLGTATLYAGWRQTYAAFIAQAQ